MVKDASHDKRSLMLLAVGVEGGLGLLALVLGWLLHQPPLMGWRWDLHDAVLGLAASMPLLVLLVICLRWPVGPLRRIERLSREVLGPLFAKCTSSELACIAILAGAGEEMFFRGLLQTLFVAWLGMWAGLALASVIFGLLHMLTLTYGVLAILMGAYLGAWWLWTDNLLVVVIVHAVYDFTALVALTRWKSRADRHEG